MRAMRLEECVLDRGPPGRAHGYQRLRRAPWDILGPDDPLRDCREECGAGRSQVPDLEEERIPRLRVHDLLQALLRRRNALAADLDEQAHGSPAPVVVRRRVQRQLAERGDTRLTD